jgi:hypothetical protein
MTSKRKYTPEELAYIQKMYTNTFTANIAKVLNRKTSLVAQKAAQMGLKKSAKFLAENCRWKPGSTIGANSRFQPGITPANKGKKQTEFMSQEGIERSKSTRFRAGQLPPNTKEDNAISIRSKASTKEKYKFIRISAQNWKLFHRHLWEEANGQIPANHLVVFKNGDTMDCRLENLEVISKAENATRNSGSLNLADGYVVNCLAWRNKKLQRHILQEHPDLIKTAKLNYQLNRKIKENEK